MCYTIVPGVFGNSVCIHLYIPWKYDTLVFRNGCIFSGFVFCLCPWVVLVHCMFVPLWVSGWEECSWSSVGVVEHMELVEVVLGLQHERHGFSIFLLRALFRSCIAFVLPRHSWWESVYLLCIVRCVSRVTLGF